MYFPGIAARYILKELLVTQFRSTLKTTPEPQELLHIIYIYTQCARVLPLLGRRMRENERESTSRGGQGVVMVDYANVVVNDFALSDN